jgi:hypothetical protein
VSHGDVADGGAHELSYHEHPDELVALLAPFVIEGLAAGERVIVIATEPHRTALSATLARKHIDIDHELLTMLDAAETLASLRPDGTIDADLFVAMASGVAGPGKRVRIFGEMVALLWEAGDVMGALELENLWNDFLEAREVRLLCAYPASTLDESNLHDVKDVLLQHDNLSGSVHHRAPGAATAVFVPVAGSVPEVRLFVGQVLRSWGEDPYLTGDVVLVASELATNAILHAASPYRLTLSRTGGSVRVALQDVADSPAEPRVPSADDTHGRGMVIVAALSRRWGCDPLPEGKVVWAELGAEEDPVSEGMP